MNTEMKPNQKIYRRAMLLVTLIIATSQYQPA
jgi:hypothetical protein